MIKISNVEVFGWESAIRGMRNPLNSWGKSDSGWKNVKSVIEKSNLVNGVTKEYVIGENDLKLMKTLSKAGSDHGKFLRMINVTLDVNAPLYWWKEFDTYKVGTVANSCSTMHKIHDKEFTLDDFSHEKLLTDWLPDDNEEEIIFFEEYGNTALEVLEFTIKSLNQFRKLYLKTKDKKYWWQMIQLLPSSYNQLRTVQLNYQVLKTMYHARKNHKLDCWVNFCNWCEELPYFKELCVEV